MKTAPSALVPDILAAHSAEEVALLRRLLAEWDFTGPAVCERVGIDSIYDFRSIREGRTAGLDLTDRLDVLIRLFMDVELLERELVERRLSGPGIELLEALGLVTAYPAEPRLCHATVLMYPTEGLWVISDLNSSPGGSALDGLAEDAVYPAITHNTRHFLASLPATPCGDFLELCAGTGIAALLASRYAGHTWAADITERATRFAGFNAALNAVENCTPLRGDLYQAVGDRRFDRIVAHPPYMPSLEQKYIFRDGGEDGEQVTRRVIAGLPEHLRPGGRLYCTCMLTDRRGARAEARIRAMLGESEGEFDVLVVTAQSFEPTEYYFRLALAGRAELTEVVRRHQIFQQLEVDRLVYCSIVVQRSRGAREVFTARRQAGPASGAAEVEWLLAWETAMARPDAVRALSGARPVASPHCRLRLSHAMREGRWAAEECVLSTAHPFLLEAKCPPWTAELLARCDGRRTVRQHLEWLKQRGEVPADAPEAEFVRLVRSLSAGGFLQIGELPPAPA